MKQADREARLQQAKAIGRVAYSHVRDGDIFGNMPIDGEEKQLREFKQSGISIELAAPFRSYAQPDEISRLRISVYGEKVFEVRWNKADFFKIIHYEPGDWERTLRAWPAPISFE